MWRDVLPFPMCVATNIVITHLIWKAARIQDRQGIDRSAQSVRA